MTGVRYQDPKKDGRPVLRFAPSPNGFLHLGHAYSALRNHDLARAVDGTLLLRFEDIDRERCRDVYAGAIQNDLAWLGVAWSGVPRRQSEHFALYRAALDRLGVRKLVYPCFCTRGAILAAHTAGTSRAGASAADASAADASAAGARRLPAHDPDGAPLYPGTCRRLTPAERALRLAEGRPAGLRLDMARALAEAPDALQWQEFGEDGEPRGVAADPAAWGDALLARKEVPTSYHLSVVVDDAAQGVTDVVRGQDLYRATGLHCLLQALLGLPTPCYHHHHLILDPEGRKLSKSRGAPSLRDFRRDGAGPAEVRRAVGLG